MLHTPAYIGHVNNNKFLLLDLRETASPVHDDDLCKLSQKLCQTRLIDDLLVLSSSKSADARYRIFGGDSREADFCCNGALFVLSMLHQEGYSQGVTLETRIGACSGLLKPGNQSLKLGSVKKVQFKPKPGTMRYVEEKYISILDTIRAGEPHLLVSAPTYLQGERFDRDHFEAVCAPLCDGFEVEGGVNVTMVFLINKGREAMIRTYERGARRMTRSCGSGSLAAASFIFSESSDAHDLMIHSPGGAHRVWHEKNNESESWWMSARANHKRVVPLGKLLDSIEDKIKMPHQTTEPITRSYFIS